MITLGRHVFPIITFALLMSGAKVGDLAHLTLANAHWSSRIFFTLLHSQGCLVCASAIASLLKSSCSARVSLLFRLIGAFRNHEHLHQCNTRNLFENLFTLYGTSDTNYSPSPDIRFSLDITWQRTWAVRLNNFLFSDGGGVTPRAHSASRAVPLYIEK